MNRHYVKNKKSVLRVHPLPLIAATSYWGPTVFWALFVGSPTVSSSPGCCTFLVLFDIKGIVARGVFRSKYLLSSPVCHWSITVDQLWRRQRWPLPPWSSYTKESESNIPKDTRSNPCWNQEFEHWDLGSFYHQWKKIYPRRMEIPRGPWLCFTISFTFFLFSRMFVSVLLREFSDYSLPLFLASCCHESQQISEEWLPMADSSTLFHLWLTDFL